MPVRWRDDTAGRETGGVGQQGAFRALLPRSTGDFPAAWPTAGCLDDAAIDRQVFKVQPDDPVLSIQAELFQRLEHSGSDPLLTPVAQRGCRAGGVSDFGVGDPEHQDLYELVGHDPIADPRPVTTQRMVHDAFGQQGRELVLDRVDDRRWHSRHEHLGKMASFDNPRSTRTRVCATSPTREDLSARPLRPASTGVHQLAFRSYPDALVVSSLTSGWGTPPSWRPCGVARLFPRMAYQPRTWRRLSMTLSNRDAYEHAR